MANTDMDRLTGMVGRAIARNRVAAGVGLVGDPEDPPPPPPQAASATAADAHSVSFASRSFA